ncbi:MAG: hypothetical protein MK085_01680 [Phycisphaerales bacterium]|nr:hypothetical protein [Phycisphaerales bacterium]
MKSISMFAGIAGLASVALATPNPLPLPTTPASVSLAVDMPADYAALISEDAIAVAWVGDLESFIKTAKQGNPAVQALPLPTSMNEMFESLMHSDRAIPMSTPILAWLEFGKNPAGAGAGDPKAFVAMKISGANENNTAAMSGTTLFFEGDMVIAAQGDSAEWSKPAKPSTRLTSLLPEKPVAIAADIAMIWKEQGSQIQMMGGFGAMAAQMALMEQMQGAKPEHQKSMRKAQQNIGQIMRSAMNGLFGQFREMTFMTMSFDVDNANAEIEMDFMFQNDLGLDQGVASEMISDLPGGMTMYAAMNDKLARALFGMDMGLMDAMMVGLDKTQQGELDAVMQHTDDLMNSITGGMTMAMHMDKSGMSKWSELAVQNSSEFISNYGLIAGQFSKVDMGIDMKNTGKGRWSIDIDGEKLGKTMDNAIMGQELSTEWGASMDLTMTNKGGNVVVAKVLPPNGAFPSSDSKEQDHLNPPAGRALVGGLVMDLPQLFYMAMDWDNPNQDMTRSMLDQMLGAQPLVIQGSARGNSMRIDISGLQFALAIPAMAQAREQAQQRLNN